MPCINFSDDRKSFPIRVFSFTRRTSTSNSSMVIYIVLEIPIQAVGLLNQQDPARRMLFEVGHHRCKFRPARGLGCVRLNELLHNPNLGLRRVGSQ